MAAFTRRISFLLRQGALFYEKLAYGGADLCIAGPSTRKRSFSFSSSSSSDDDSDTYVYLVSGSEDSDDGELSSSSGDDEDSGEANIASAREWILLGVDNPPVKPPRFPFLAIPGKTFILSSPVVIMEYIHQFLDDELLSLVVDETNRKAAEKLKCSTPSDHSRLKKWVPVTKKEMWVFHALLLLQRFLAYTSEERCGICNCSIYKVFNFISSR
ncbi:hypothetical protein HPB48_006383 [Haemaphysalis longicornis]|uniref:PiggyBac transposable element-derived protein domain-containing protein n=1 Tax=Haemaphysalis longicornis TaxID=44386 RepID=A0A9J6FJP6_HAELO|nr:hypothetical protein HPB48_006383 [Haemaphysalis longicornis]